MLISCLKLGAENDLFTGQRRRQRVGRVHPLSCCLCVWTLHRLRGWGEFAEVRMARRFFPASQGMCVHFSDASKDQSECCALTSISQSTYRASSFLVRNDLQATIYINSQHFTIQASLCPSTCFSINSSPCVKTETRGHLCLSIMCRFLPSRCIGAALNLPSLNDWSGWEVTVYGGGGQCRL